MPWHGWLPNWSNMKEFYFFWVFDVKYCLEQYYTEQLLLDSHIETTIVWKCINVDMMAFLKPKWCVETFWQMYFPLVMLYCQHPSIADHCEYNRAYILSLLYIYLQMYIYIDIYIYEHPVYYMKWLMPILREFDWVID